MGERKGILGRLFGRGDDGGPPPEWAAYLGTRGRFDRFEAAVREHFDRAGVRFDLVDGVVRLRSGPDDGMQLGLGNLSQLCAQAPEKAWPGLVAQHFAAMAEMGRQEQELERQIGDYGAMGPRLVVRLWEREQVARQGLPLVEREDIPGLAAVLAIDFPRSVRTLKREEVERWGRPDDELFRRALDNVVKATPLRTERLDLDGGGAIAIFTSDSPYFVASMALRPSHLAPALGRHGAFVSVPVRETILVLPLNGPEDLARMQSLLMVTIGMERDGPGSVSRRVYWLMRDRYVEIPYEADEGKLSVTPPQELVDELERMAKGAR